MEKREVKTNEITKRFCEAVNFVIVAKSIKTKKEIADKLGISAQQLNEILNGNNNATPAQLSSMSASYGVSASYLLTGEGPIMKEDEKATNSAYKITLSFDLAPEDIPSVLQFLGNKNATLNKLINNNPTN